MILAEGGFFFALVMLGLVVGFFGFFFFALLAIFRFVGSMFRRFFLDDSVSPAHGAHNSAARRVFMCGNPQCRHMNIPSARFCARCGLRLRGGSQVDYHG